MQKRPLDALDTRVAGANNGNVSRRQVAAVIAAAAVAGAFSLSVAIRQYGPTVHPDEWGSLLNGQVIVGHLQAPVVTGSFYPAGFGLVTGSLAVLAGSMAGGYRATLVFNFVLCLLVAVAAYALARRLMGAARGLAVLASALVFVAPGTIVTSLYAWPETASRLAFLVFVLWLHSVAGRRSATAVLPFALYVGLLPGLHGRFTLVLPVVCLLFLWWGWKGLAGRVVAVLACGVTAAGYVCAYALNTFVKHRIYGASYDQENRLLRRLVHPSVWPALVRTMTGQSWYLVATSTGLVAVAAAFIVIRIRDGRAAGIAADPQRATFAVVALSSVLLVFTGGLQLLYGNRGDHLIYGRYVEILVPVLLVIACGTFGRNGFRPSVWWLRGTAFTLLVAFVYVLVDQGDAVKGGWARDAIVFPNIVGTDFLRYVLQPGLITFALAFAAVGAVAWWLAARSGTWSIVLVVVLLAAGSSVSVERSVLSRTKDLRLSGTTVGYVRASGTDRVAYYQGEINDKAYYYLRYKLDPVQVYRFAVVDPDDLSGVAGLHEGVPVEYACVYGMPGHPPAPGEWKVVGEEKVLERVLFQRVGTDHC